MGEIPLYYFIRGPLLWIAFLVFVGGIVFRTIQFFKLTRKKDPLIFFPPKNHKERYGKTSDQERKMRFIVSLKNSILGQHQAVAILTSLFHVLIFILPIFLLAHNLLLYESWNFSLWSFSESTGDTLTLLFLFLAMFFFDSPRGGCQSKSTHPDLRLFCLVYHRCSLFDRVYLLPTMV